MPHAKRDHRPRAGSWHRYLLPAPRRRLRTDWAGVGIGDAFRATSDYRVRLSAQRLFYDAVKEAQRSVLSQLGDVESTERVPCVSPQISPCYTSYPASMAALAAIGLTAYLEFQQATGDTVLAHYLQDYLANPAEADEVRIDADLYGELARRVAKAVQSRLLVEDLGRTRSLVSVEAYRLFAASHRSHFRFHTVVDIVNTVVLYGDVLPPIESLSLPSTTRDVLAAVISTCRPFLNRLAQTRSDLLLDVGCEWVRAICVRLAAELSAIDARRDSVEDDPLSASSTTGDFSLDDTATPPTDRPQLPIPPLDSDPPLRLFESLDLPRRLDRDGEAGLSEVERDLRALRQHLGEETEEDTRREAIREFSQAVASASEQSGNWEDMRFDLVELQLGLNAFEAGPIEGSPASGHEVAVRLDENEVVSGELFDRPVELSDDAAAYAELLRRCEPTTDAISRVLYPSIEFIPLTERLCTSGSLDPARLALGEISSAIFRRTRITRQADLRGSALLAIACDGSGSLNAGQMQMLKTLTGSWLLATVKSDVRVMAGLYHSGAIRSGVTGPLVQWLAHPHKTPAIGNRDAVRGLVALPESGTGAQADALSLSFLMEEARKLTGGTVYLIHITDCQWNRSFHTDRTGEDEVRALLGYWRKDPRPLHITLVALGVSETTGLEDLVDQTITIAEEEMQDFEAVAGKIGRYVANCMTERNRHNASR